ncbi:MAG: sensor histidine kinase [Enterococcus sp.]
MIAKISKEMAAVYIGITSFLTMVLLLFSFFYASGRSQWWATAFQTQIFYLPIIIYILVISLAIGVVAYILISLARRSLYGSIEEKLRLVANGNFDNEVLIKAIPHATENHYLQDIDQEIGKIAEQLKNLSAELQLATNRPQLHSGETKEEILEIERHRLARELHDSVSQQLFAAMMMMSALNEQAIKQDAPAAQRKQLALVTEIINASQSEMRALLLHLRPVNLEGKTLKKGIEQLLMELQTKIKIALKWDVEELTMAPAIEDQLFRVIQELLSNTLRHAKAEELEVYLHQVNQSILLRVIDDGVGFDPNNQKTGSYGLLNIRERVQGVGGTIKIISFKNQGTSIEIKIPLVEEESQ